MMEFLQFHISKMLVDFLIALGVIVFIIFYNILFKKDK